MAPSRRTMIILLVIAFIVTPCVVGVLAIYIENWSRDLTTNRAATDPNDPDPRLRPLERPGPAEAVWEDIAGLIAERPAWSKAEPTTPLGKDSPLAELWRRDGVGRLTLIHTTRLMRYRDDVWVAVEPLDRDRVRVWAESRSRIGRGDLGQNPRNLRELLAALGG